MAPSLKISAGASIETLQTVAVNHEGEETATVVESDDFEGRIVVRIKAFTGTDPAGVEHHADAAYFEADHGVGQSWSMQIQGRFKEAINADDLVFGNEFEEPIRAHLPYGTALALQFVKLVDPNIEHDLYADRPHAWSPYLATMPRVCAAVLPDTKGEAAGADAKFAGWPALPAPPNYVYDDISCLVPADMASAEADAVANLRGGPDGIERAHAFRARFLSDAKHRRALQIEPHHIITADFFNAYVDFNDLTLHIPFSGGLKFDLKKYWDGQPVRYIAKNRRTGTVFFVIQFDITDLTT